MSRADIPEWQREIVPAKTAFFLDVDGTLLGFEERPEDVAADEELLSVLSRLRTAADGAVALVSGRMVDDLDRIMSPIILPAGGVHGADLRFADGRREAFEGEAFADVRDVAERFVEANKGLRFEDKGGSTFALHFRQQPDLADDVARFLDDVVAGRELMVQHGKMVAEVKPKRCNKGIAINRLMETPPFTGRLPFFIGDDLTDEYGFETVNERGGVSVKVGDASEQTVAHYRLADTSAVRALLQVLSHSEEG